MPLRLISAFGLLLMVLLAWALSYNRKRFPYRVVLVGTALQLLFAILVLKTTPGLAFFKFLGDTVTNLLNYVDQGSMFVFGTKFTEIYFAFKVLPTIIFFSALMSVLYHLGIMQRIVLAISWVMQKTMKISGAESLSAAANIFVGQTEAPLVIRPYINEMTVSELAVVMCGGFATVAGGVLAAYVGMGIDAAHLITASVISAPAALVIAKIIVPEVGVPKTLGVTKFSIPKTTSNLFDAATEGASEGVRLAINVGAMIIAFLALIALVDDLVRWMLSFSGLSMGLMDILAYAFSPLAWAMGIESADILPVGELLGIKMVSNEFIAYEKLSGWMKAESAVQLSERSKVIATYALCGFANFGSIGIQLGGIGVLAPERRKDLAKIAFRAMLGGTIACFMTGCIAGLLI